MSKNQFETVELSLASYEEKDGKFFFTAKSLSSDFECEAVLERLAEDSINKHLIWRHKHPIQDENNESHIYGTIYDSKIVDGHIISTYQAYDHTKDHRDFIELIKERDIVNDPLGISMRYRKYYVEDKINHADVFEHSGTPFPKCTECLIDDYIGEKKMPDEIKPDAQKPESKDDELEQKKLEKHLAKIAELEKTLNSRTEILEGYKSKIETLEKEVKNVKDSNTQETVTLEDRVKHLEEKLEKQGVDHKAEIDLLAKKPILDEMFEIRPKLDKVEKALYTEQKEEYLKVKLEEWKEIADNTPIVKPMDESADEAMEKGEDEEKDDVEEEINEKDVRKFTQMLDKRVQDLMLKHIKKEE